MIFAQCFNRSSSLSLARPSPNAWFGAPRMLAINVQKDDIRICQIDIWDLSVSFSFLMEWIQEIDGNRANSWFNGYFWRGPCGEHVWLFHVRCCNLLQFRLIFQDYQIARFSTAAIWRTTKMVTQGLLGENQRDPQNGEFVRCQHR